MLRHTVARTAALLPSPNRDSRRHREPEFDYCLQDEREQSRLQSKPPITAQPRQSPTDSAKENHGDADRTRAEKL